MNKFHKTIATGAATASMLMNMALPAFAVDLMITGNGSESESQIQVTNTNSTVVSQNNESEVKNKINVTADTGNNSASDNTGGAVHVETGDADVNVTLENMLNSNVAEVESCGSCVGDTAVVIDGNGSDSVNRAALSTVNAVQLYQDNKAEVKNYVNADANTGRNDADDNTGGDVIVLTGNVDVDVVAKTVANANSASVGASSGEGSSVGVMITGNGSGSENETLLALTRATIVTQDNDSDITNDFDVEGVSGDNSITDTTGGDVAISTGHVDILGDVMNSVGFNHFDDGDCCFDDIWAKVGANGSDTWNLIDAVLESEDAVFQENNPEFDTWMDLVGHTGRNDADDSTGDAESDPIILTGNSDVVVSVVNDGASNVMGESDPVSAHMPQLPGIDLSISLDLSAVLADLLAGLV